MLRKQLYQIQSRGRRQVLTTERTYISYSQKDLKSCRSVFLVVRMHKILHRSLGEYLVYLPWLFPRNVSTHLNLFGCRFQCDEVQNFLRVLKHQKNNWAAAAAASLPCTCTRQPCWIHTSNRSKSLYNRFLKYRASRRVQINFLLQL